MQFSRLLAVAAFFWSTCRADITIEPFNDVVVLPSQNGLSNDVSLLCRIHNAVGVPNGHWLIQNEETQEVMGIGIKRGKYFAPLPIDGYMSLDISELSYKHNGNYTCRVRKPSTSPQSIPKFISANITLSLKLELEVSFVVMNNSDSVELRCEMSQYIEPDKNLQWFRNGHMINANSSKYQIQFEDGNTPSLIDGVRTPSRISVLVVSDFKEQNDSGYYHCRTLSTHKSASVFVGQEEPDISTTFTIPTPTNSPTRPDIEGNSTNATGSTPRERDEGEGGLLEGVPVVTIVVAGSCVGLVLIFLAVLLIMMCYICRKSRQKNATNDSDYASAVANMNLWNDFSPPLPPRPNERIRRVSQTSDYYMNDGMGPEKQYSYISPYTSMASFPNITFTGDNTSANNEYIQISNGNEDKQYHDYINAPTTGEIENQDDKTSNNEYVYIPDNIQESIPHHYDQVPRDDESIPHHYDQLPRDDGSIPLHRDQVPEEDDASRDDTATSALPDEPKADNGSNYDRLTRK